MHFFFFGAECASSSLHSEVNYVLSLMGETSVSGANAPDADAKSDSSLESLKPFNRAEVKPGPGALPPSTFDPLRHEDYEIFWNDIDKYFYPITTQDLSGIRNLPVNPFGAIFDAALRLPVPPDDPAPAPPPSLSVNRHTSTALTNRIPASATSSGGATATSATGMGTGMGTGTHSFSSAPGVPSSSIDLLALPSDHGALNSFPLTQRLIAAFIDEGGGGMPSSAPQRPARGPAAETEQFWAGVGTEHDLRKYQRVMEERVTMELRELNLVPDPGDELQSLMRHEQWRLRDLKTSNRARKLSLYTHVVGTELRRQALNREVKRHENQTEIFFIERMIKKLKKNKKARNKYPKLLSKMFKDYKQNKPAVVPPSPRGAVNGSAGTPASSGGVQAAVSSGVLTARQIPAPIAEERSQSKTKSAKKKKRKSDVGPSRPPTAAKSAASKGKAHQVDGNSP